MSRTLELLDRAWVLLKEARLGCLLRGERDRTWALDRAMNRVARAEGRSTIVQELLEETPAPTRTDWMDRGVREWMGRKMAETGTPAIREAVGCLSAAEGLALEEGNRQRAEHVREALGYAAAAADPAGGREARPAERPPCDQRADRPQAVPQTAAAPPCVPPGSGATRGSRLQCPCCGAWVETEVRLVAGQE